MKLSKAIVAVAAATAVMVTGVACSSEADDKDDTSTATQTVPEGQRLVKDMAGTDVLLPNEVHRVVNLWHANNQVQLLLGGADKLVGTTSIIKGLPWFQAVYPRIDEVPALAVGSGSSNFNVEEIAAQNPDVVITSSTQDAETLRNAGLTTAVVTFRDFDGLKQSVRTTAEILGDDAPARADTFLDYFDGNLTRVNDRLAGLADDEKVRVYEARDTNPLATDGKESIATQWIEAAGGVNVAASMTDENMGTVNLEQVLAADPQVIIAAMQDWGPLIDTVKNDPAWAPMSAVKEGKIFANPVGTFQWSRYSAEEALQVLWAAKLLHPDRFTDLDMIAEAQSFYRMFYDYELSPENAQRMLDGLGPQ